MKEDAEEPLVISQFNLPTHQRRLRHLQSITVRNLVFPNVKGLDIINLQVYFTLHKDDKSKAFYTSEKIAGSLNPTWQSFDLQRNDSDTDLTSKYVVVRVWVGTAKGFKVKVEWHVHLSGLMYFSDRLQVAGLKHAPDTLLFGLYNHFFCYLDETQTHTQLKSLVPDSHIPQNTDLLHAVLLDQSTLRPSYNVNYLSRIHTVLRAIKQTNASVRRVHNTIEDTLVSSKERSEKLSKREALLIRMRQLRQELFWQQQQCQKDEQDLQNQQAINESKARDIKNKTTTLNQQISEYEEARQVHIETREMYMKESAQVMFRRRQLSSELLNQIYSIKKKEKDEYYICNVRLPNAEEYQGHDENMIAAALGFVCHLLMMTSQFLDIPLRYPMIYRGSRSVIIDNVHSKLADKDREFPLYGKGKEKFQYNYGVFLLNKNISQLRFYCGLGTSDLRQTLSNLKSLMEQKLGFRNLSPSHHGIPPSASTTLTASLENSNASQISLAPSSSSSSLLLPPHLTSQQYHHQQHHPIHYSSRYSSHPPAPSPSVTSVDTNKSEKFDLMSLEITMKSTNSHTQDEHSSPLIFKNSREESVNNGQTDDRNFNANGDADVSLSSWVESASKLTAAHVESKDSNKDSNFDDGEDLFLGSNDDGFFSSRPFNVDELFKSTGEVALLDSSNININTNGSFKMVKTLLQQSQGTSNSTDDSDNATVNRVVSPAVPIPGTEDKSRKKADVKQ